MLTLRVLGTLDLRGGDGEDLPDATMFERAVAEGRLDDALMLYGGSLFREYGKKRFSTGFRDFLSTLPLSHRPALHHSPIPARAPYLSRKQKVSRPD